MRHCKAAAWAKLLLLPTTNVSNVFFAIKTQLARRPVAMRALVVFSFGIGRASFAGGRRCGLDCFPTDLEFDFKGLTGAWARHILDQAQVIVLEPELTKIIGHREGESLAFQSLGPE